MNKKILLTGILLFTLLLFSISHAVIAENNYTVDSIIATKTDADENITALIENVQVDGTENFTNVTFDLTNISLQTDEFSIYTAVYKQNGALFSVDVEKKILNSGEKQQLTFNIKIPNSDNNAYGRIFVWDNNMKPASEYGSFTFANENPDILSDIIITDDVILTTDMSYNNVTLEGGTVDLHGHKLYINGDLLQPGGTMYINGGQLTINGDYRIQTKDIQTDQYGDTQIVYGSSSGILNMKNENDRILLNGNFYTQSNYSHSEYLQNGVFELKGNFNQLEGYYSNFDASKNHKVVFSGTEQQVIYFDDTTSGFANVDFINENILIDSNIRGWRMTTDLTLNGDIINNSLGANVPLDFNGHTVHIKGNYVQSEGELNLNGGSLIIDGDYRIQYLYDETDQYGDTTTKYGGSSGILNMTNENDRVLVSGNFYTQSTQPHSEYLRNGIFELKGNFNQLDGYYSNFDANKNHKVIFSGAEQQVIYFYDTNSGFANVEFANENILITSPLRGWTLSTDLTLNGDLINNSLGVGVPMNLNGFKLHIKGNYIQSDGEMYINNGSLVIDGDYRIQYQYDETDQYGDTTTKYGGSSGILNMTNENDRVLVSGNFYTQSTQPHSEYLRNGIFELKGNFNQLDGYYSNFDANKNHKVIFSGAEQQVIYFYDTNSGFANVEFANENILITSPLRGWTLSTDLTLNGDLINNSLGVGVPMNLNGFKLHIKGNYVQSDGEMYINNGSLVIDGDYRLQYQYDETNQYGDTTTKYGGSSGILNMTNENDRVLVNGNFYTQSTQSHSEYLQNGILEIKGNFNQLDYDNHNFDANSNHKVIFSGKDPQNIYFYSTSSGFANVEFKNENILIDSNIRGWQMTTDLTLNGDLINNSLGVGVPMNLNGFKLHIKGNYVQSDGEMYINNGSLVIDGDYRLQYQYDETNQYGDTTTKYGGSSGILNMTNENDRVLVNGNFYTQSYQTHSAYLRNGILEIKGNFNQLDYDNYNFDANSNHKVVLSGSEKQNIYFERESSQFNILILTKPYETGYTFNRIPCWNTLYQADAVSINYGGQSGTYAPTGNYSRDFTDMTIISAAGDMPIKRTYNSQDEESSVFNQGWTLSVSAKLTDEGNGYKQVKLPDGSTAAFKESNGAYESLNSRSNLSKAEDGTYALTSKSQVKYRFSSDGKIISMSDRYGNTTLFETNSDGNITALIEPSGKRYSFSYSGKLLTGIKDETSGATVSYGYTNGRLTSAVNPAGVNTYYEYDDNGRLIKILDHDRNAVEIIAYNSDNKVDYVIDADGNKSTYAYDLADGKTTITDSNGKQKIQWYDSTFNVTKNQDAEGGITATEYNMTDGMNKYNEPRTVTDRNGRNTYYERDNRGNITKQSNPDGSYKLFEYDDNNNITSVRDENGNYTYYIYDDTKTKLLKQVKPLDGVSRYSDVSDKEQFVITEYTYYDDEYKIKGLVKSKTEPEGLISEFSYDNNGMLTSVKMIDSKDGTVGTTEYRYNKLGLLEYEISPDGYKTTYEYDKSGNLTKLTANNGDAVSLVEYDAAGRKIKEISPNEYAKSGNNAVGQTYSYYPSGKVKSETDALGNTTSYNYDIYGNLTNQINPDGSEHKYEYDDIARKTKEYFRDKNDSDFVLTNEYTYSVDSGKNSQIAETVWLNDIDSITTVNTLDYKENLIEQLRADGTSITKSYDGKGNIKSETDAKGNTKDYAYDALGNVIQEKIPFDSNYQYKKYSYDKAGNRLSEKITNQSSGSAEEYSLTEYGYNSRGMLISAAGYDNGVIKSAAQYVYDNAGNKVRVYTGLSSLLTINGVDDITENGDSDYAVRKYEYDYNGNMTKAVDTLGNEETYAYDNNGNRISYTDRNGNTAVYEYDNMNRLIRKSSGNSSYSYTYDSMGNKTSVSGDFNAQYEYDSKGNLLSETTDNYSKTYTYDLQGNTDSFSLNYNEEEKSNLQYNYDNRGRLASILDGETEIAAYTYDENGNRTSVTYDNGIITNYEFNKANLITAVRDNNNEYTYDYYMNGKQKSKTENGTVENYEYDDLGRLTKAGSASYEYDDFSNRIGDYSYDKNGRIIGFTYDNNGNLLSDGEHTYTYDRWNRLVNADGESYVYDDMNSRIMSGAKSIVNDGIHMVYITDGTNEQIYKNGASPVYSIRNGEKAYFSYNGHGDVVGLIDTSGNTVETYSYDVFGNEKNISENDENPLRYAGQYYDMSSGNYYMNSRYYSADMGRFLSQDSFYGNDEDVLSLNQYTYCYNDPIQYIDLSGNSVVSTAKSIVTDSLTKAGKDTIKGFLKDQYASAIGCEPESVNYFGTFLEKSGKNVLKNSGSKAAKKLGLSTEYSVFEPVIESGIKNINEEFNASQKENRDFNAGNVVGNTASGIILSYIKSAPGVGTVYDMCLDLSNGDIFKNLTVKTFTKAVDVVGSNMGYEPINWNAGKDIYKTDSKQFSNDYNSFRSKGWSSNTSYWYALSQSLSRKVSRGNSWLKNNGYIR